MSIKRKTLVDTNVILRFLLNDNPKQASEAEKFFIRAQEHQLEIPDVVITELIYVLLSFYKLQKAEVTEKIRALITYPKFFVNVKIIDAALDIFVSNNVSFVDAYLLATARSEKTKGLYTFDKRLSRILKIKN